jgi:hypothetical protein
MYGGAKSGNCRRMMDPRKVGKKGSGRDQKGK